MKNGIYDITNDFVKEFDKIKGAYETILENIKLEKEKSEEEKLQEEDPNNWNINVGVALSVVAVIAGIAIIGKKL